jgi:1,4-alpha-glucan branching enzyme
VLPLLETEAGIRLQVRNGVASARERFGRFGGGFWLPECAYRPGLEAPLADAGVVAFCVDQTRPPEDLDCASGSDPSCDFDQPEPVLTAAGAVAVPIDWGTIELVWSDNGYPSNSRYRDYHAHTINGLRPWANSGVPYDHEAGARQARADAHQFIGQVAGRLGRYRAERGRPGLLVVALDTELLGHWWYEGAIWLDAVREQALEAGIALAKLPQALERHEPAGRPLRESTWGQRKDLSTWDSPRVEHLRWPAACAELELVTSSLKFRHWEDRKALAAAVRELLLLQSSDWAFMETRELAADYPSRRVAGHSMAFARALAAATGGVKDSRPVPGADQYLQGLAPSLDLSGLFEPASPLGRQALQAAGGADI